LGSWEVAEEKQYVRVVLNADGSCLFVAGSIIGDKRDGIGGRCRYFAKGSQISITEMRGIDGSGPVEKVNPPMRLKYESRTDSLSIVNESTLKLFRVRK